MKNKNLIYYLLMLLPFVDLLTSLQTRSSLNIPSIGMFIKSLLELTIIFYIFFRSASKYKKISIIYFISIFSFVLGYFIFKTDLLNIYYLKTEISHLFRMLYLPILFTGFLNYFEEYGFNKVMFIKSMIVTLIEYTILLLIPLLFNIAFESYSTGLHGYVGWFYAANEISVIMVLLLPFAYYLINKGKYNFFITLPIIYTISCIGTKVTFAGTFIVVILGLLFGIIKNKFRFNKEVFSLFCVLIFCSIFFLGNKAIALNNAKQLAEKQKFEFIETPVNQRSNKKQNAFKKEIQAQFTKTMHFLLSNRDDYLKQTLNIYENTFSYDYILFGMGYSNTSRINNKNIDKFIEIDYLDLYFHDGLCGLVIEIIPFLIAFVEIIKHLFKNKLTRNNVCFILYNLFIVLMALSIAAIAGHVIMYPAVAIYLCLYLLFLLNSTNRFAKKEIDNKKVQIMALHLKIGGIETVICNEANMLAENFNVEIVSLYKTSCEYPLNENIKVTYLMNTISNRNEFKIALKEHNILKIIKEGIKAIKILYLKPLLLKRSIINSDAKVIISSRRDFSSLVGKYHRDNIVTISEEHVYHKNDVKYINKVINANKHVDYMLPTSLELTNFYRDKVNAKVEYIPNIISYYPNKRNSLNNKKILAVGRLSKEKGFVSLVEVMKEVVKKDRKITLDIYGDGEEKDNILKAIKKNNLENNISLKGFISPNELNSIRKDYSLVLCSSYEESFGLAVLESMAFGIPCITFDDAKGLLEFVSSENGVIISNRDSKQMAKEIVEILNDKNKLTNLSKNAFIKAKEYSFDIVKDKFNTFIKNAISLSKTKEKRVMFISSSGGHFNELMQLRKLFDKYDYQIITEKSKTNAKLKEKYGNRIKYLHAGTRFHPVSYFLVILPCNCFRSLYYYIKYKPQYIVTTGAHSAGPMCCIGKIFSSKIIFIESFANIHSKTATGKIIYHFADLFIVQWEYLLKVYPNAIYGGWIY